MLAYVLLRLARLWGDDELEARGVSVLRLVRDRSCALPSSFGWMLVALDQYLAPHRELAIVGDRDAPVAQAALAAAAPTDVVAFGPDEGDPAARGPRPGRRRDRRLRLRALRLPGAGHRGRGPGAARAGARVTLDGAPLDPERHAPLRRHRRDRRRVARRRAGPDRRPDRPERCRQDDALQRDHAALPARLGRARVRRQEPAAHAARPDRAPRHRPHVPERRALPLDDGARQRARRLAHPHPAVRRRGGRPSARAR